MHTMDEEGLLQKLLAAAAATATPTPTPITNTGLTIGQMNMMLFSPTPTITSPVTTSSSSSFSNPSTIGTSGIPTDPVGQMAWPLKNPLMNPLPAEVNISTLLYLHQVLQQQNQAQLQIQQVPAALTPSTPVIPAYSFLATPTTVISSSPTACSSNNNTPTPPEGLQTTFPSMFPILPPTPTEETRKISGVSINTEFPSVASSSSSFPASSPSTSSRRGSEDVEEFVDVESVDVAVDGKEKRRAHVEFYRRMKSMRHQETAVTCQSCRKRIDNQENALTTHVAEHAEAGGFQCRICGWQSVDKYKIYAHMREEHPRKVDMFADKRDMPKMCKALSKCFPKSSSRPKKESNQNADTYFAQLLQQQQQSGGPGDRACEVCKAKVRLEKTAMVRHVQNNHIMKCKTCKIVSDNLEEQLAHQSEVHQQDEPKMSVHYAPSAAAIHLLPGLEKCFPI